MELTELLLLLKEPKKLVDTIIALAPVIPQEAYDIEPENHRVVKDLQYRPWRDVEEPTGVLDDKGNMTFRTVQKDVHRVPSNTQKTIIDWATRMALSGGIDRDYRERESVASDPTMSAMLDRTWDDNKLDFICQKIDKLKRTYTQCLAVWYSVPAEEGFWDEIAPTSKFKMRISIFSPKDGSIAIPIYDQYQDQIACARSYSVKIGDKQINKLDLHLQDSIITYTEADGGWEELGLPLPYKKANYIFHGQDRTEFADVQAKIERVEEGDSDASDENQLSSFPILAAIGDIEGTSGGGTKNTRKTFALKDGGDLKYVESQGGQKSAIEERKNLRQDIYDETSTPHVSMENIQGTGNTPGVAIEMAFLPATNKAKSAQQGDLGMEWQRHLNFLKSAMAVINVAVAPSVSMTVKPVFKIELPRNLSEEYANIVSLVGAGLMSKETAIKKLGFTDNPEAEYERIKTEAAEAAKPVTPPTNA